MGAPEQVEKADGGTVRCLEQRVGGALARLDEGPGPPAGAVRGAGSRPRGGVHDTDAHLPACRLDGGDQPDRAGAHHEHVVAAARPGSAARLAGRLVQHHRWTLSPE